MVQRPSTKDQRPKTKDLIMDEMHELVTVDQMNRLFLLLAVALPVTGLVVGAALGARSKAAASGAAKGFVVGLLGPLNLLLWTMYNALTNRMGLDTVKNLLVQLAIFVVLGGLLGLIAGRIFRNG